MNPLSVALLQGTAGGETNAARDAANELGDQTGNRLDQIRDSFGGVYEYFVSAEFIANVIVTVIVAALGILFYEVLTRGVPLALRWRRSLGDAPQDAETITRRKRQDTAIALARNALRYVIFAVIALFAVSFFLRGVLPALGERGAFGGNRGFRGAELPARHHRGVLDHLRRPVQRRGLRKDQPPSRGGRRG